MSRPEALDLDTGPAVEDDKTGSVVVGIELFNNFRFRCGAVVSESARAKLCPGRPQRINGFRRAQQPPGSVEDVNAYIPESTTSSLNKIQTELIFTLPDWDSVSAETAGFGIVELSEISLFNQLTHMLAGISKPIPSDIMLTTLLSSASSTS